MARISCLKVLYGHLRLFCKQHRKGTSICSLYEKEAEGTRIERRVFTTHYTLFLQTEKHTFTNSSCREPLAAVTLLDRRWQEQQYDKTEERRKELQEKEGYTLQEDKTTKNVYLHASRKVDAEGPCCNFVTTFCCLLFFLCSHARVSREEEIGRRKGDHKAPFSFDINNFFFAVLHFVLCTRHTCQTGGSKEHYKIMMWNEDISHEKWSCKAVCGLPDWISFEPEPEEDVQVVKHRIGRCIMGPFHPTELCLGWRHSKTNRCVIQQLWRLLWVRFKLG